MFKAKKFMFRLSDPYVQIGDRKQDRHFPPIDKLSYDNYLVAVNEILAWEYQFTLADGANCGTRTMLGNNWTSLKIS